MEAKGPIPGHDLPSRFHDRMPDRDRVDGILATDAFLGFYAAGVGKEVSGPGLGARVKVWEWRGNGSYRLEERPLEIGDKRLRP